VKFDKEITGFSCPKRKKRLWWKTNCG